MKYLNSVILLDVPNFHVLERYNLWLEDAVKGPSRRTRIGLLLITTMRSFFFNLRCTFAAEICISGIYECVTMVVRSHRAENEGIGPE